MSRAQSQAPSVAAVGTFDGFHPGHQAVVSRIIEIARSRGLTSHVLTFDRHPLSLIAPERAPGWAYPREESAYLIHRAGVERVVSLPFTEQLRRLTAVEFMRMVKNDYGVQVLVMGYDNTFGSDRLASPAEYERAGEQMGVRVEWVKAVNTSEGECPSSSSLRKALKNGDIDRYASLSGHLPMLAGKVQRGKQNGRKIGIPTMNVATGGLCLPPAGVYAARYLPDGGEPMVAVLNIGDNPTIAAHNPVTVELHVPDADLGDMYGRRIRFELVAWLRPERKFPDLDSLQAAIHQDIAAAKQRSSE